MTEYPEKTCQIDRLVRQPKLVSAALSGQKTQQRRDGLYAYPGETFELEGVTFVVTEVARQRLGDMTDRDAQAEGYPNLAMYKDLILKMHANMEWNEDGLVWVHGFKRQQPE
ncbi:ASCH domain-containing protein [Methylomonas sp. SURF-2]|uniref:ASCH domain-containing protein n=1 Tax=Methylomonas subterranea TaxID=2952225 RepID=A0ABT1TFI5_9GAMM|nr:ASCH domain-containing protein [Methylomonas sp. SURF-2]MCQ8104064.1 ASCH domain-containing protein [Methylomonas sp. SURF-2]